MPAYPDEVGSTVRTHTPRQSTAVSAERQVWRFAGAWYAMPWSVEPRRSLEVHIVGQQMPEALMLATGAVRVELEHLY